MSNIFDCPNIYLKEGSYGENVKILQRNLKKCGYYTYVNGHYLSVDGKYQKYTKSAVTQLQKATNNSQSGIFDSLTCASLTKLVNGTATDYDLFDCSKTSLSEGSTETNAVKLLQKMLVDLNYYQGSIDGDFGKYTKDSLQEFQRLINEEDNGVFTGTTCKTLCDHYKSMKKKQAVQNATKTNVAKTTAPLVDPNKPDLSRNIWDISSSQLSIDGINIIATSIEPNTAFNNGNWKQIELMNGHFYTYKAHNQPMQWTVESHMHKDELKQLYPEFVKMQNRVCRVVSNHMIGGRYVISIKYTNAKGYYRKVTLTLTEYY